MVSRGNTLIYGKVTLSSEIESMDSIIKHLGDVLAKHGYPESGPQKSEKTRTEIQEAERKLKEMMDHDSEENESLQQPR
jgi:hypothetical protein